MTVTRGTVSDEAIALVVGHMELSITESKHVFGTSTEHSTLNILNDIGKVQVSHVQPVLPVG